MAKHRTKKDRIKAAKRRQIIQSIQAKPVAKKVSLIKVKENNSIAQLFAYDPKLIIKDLKKTLLFVSLILVVLLGLALIYT